ncbi:hypothetical protein LTR97_004697 [Elasticomyces elasticus]|uniref:Uncharacterized protein n=1 Tax=Elasticomyces elasticus TaxID=574655 RepID=A0AAN8A3J8_9PEZI|nr:hypothetical protein LTR97_004697 [Elasticomyces elasticus]
MGVLCILGAVAGVAASIAILRLSDGVPITDWRYAPTVYLSISYTITNILLAIALSHGVTISWWRRALGAKTELGDLHRYWNFGTSPLAAATAGRKFNFIAFASLIVAITPANGPLLQRSSSVTVRQTSAPITLQIQSVPSIQAPTGYMSGRGLIVSLLSQDFAPVVQSFYDHGLVSADGTGCPRDAPYNINPSTPFNPSTDPSVIGTDVFTTEFIWGPRMYPANFSLNTQYKDSMTPSDCSGMLTVQNCSLRAATVQYPVIIDGNRSTITLDPASTIIDDNVIALLDYPSTTFPGLTALGGYAFALNNRFKGVSHLRFVGAVGYELLSTGATGPQFANTTEVKDRVGDMCNITFADPIQNLLAQARELMFRTALAFGNATTVETVSGMTDRTSNVYQSHYAFLAAAVALTVASILVVLATFHGFWELGRVVSMSPVEIVKAFNAPLLAAEDSNADAKELVEAAGTRPVRYRLVANAPGSKEGRSDSEGSVPDTEGTDMHLEICDLRVVN